MKANSIVFFSHLLLERYYNWKVFYLTIVSLSKPCCHSSSAVYDFTCSSRCLFYLFQTTKMKKKNFVNKRPKLMVSFCFQFFPNICTRTIISSWFCQRIPGGQNDNESINKSFSHVWLKSRWNKCLIWLVSPSVPKYIVFCLASLAFFS